MILKTALDFHSLYLKKLIASICVRTFSITVCWCKTGCVTELVLYFQLSVKGLVKTEIIIIHLVESPCSPVLYSNGHRQNRTNL